MKARNYLVITSLIFGIVAVLHLLRLISGLEVTIGSWPAPLWFSWLGTIAPAVLCLWGIRLATRPPWE